MVGILVHGDNHFVVHGPLPDRDAARALIRHWSIIQILRTSSDAMSMSPRVYRNARYRKYRALSYRY
jgi:hypothetical protein